MIGIIILNVSTSEVGFAICIVQGDAAQIRDAAAAAAATGPSKGPRNNNSPTKGLLGNAG